MGSSSGASSVNKKKRNRLLLHDLACALNACEKAGLKPMFVYEAVYTEHGYVFRVKNRWVARKLKRR